MLAKLIWGSLTRQFHHNCIKTRQKCDSFLCTTRDWRFSAMIHRQGTTKTVKLHCNAQHTLPGRLRTATFYLFDRATAQNRKLKSILFRVRLIWCTFSRPPPDLLLNWAQNEQCRSWKWNWAVALFAVWTYHTTSMCCYHPWRHLRSIIQLRSTQTPASGAAASPFLPTSVFLHNSKLCRLLFSFFSLVVVFVGPWDSRKDIGSRER